MSNDNNQLGPVKETDLEAVDLAKVKEFEEQGMPGLASLDENKLARMLDLYLSGKTYYEISNIMHVKRALVCFLAKKYDWYGMRKEFLTEIQVHKQSKVLEAKMISQDFLVQLTHFWQKKIGGNIQRYLESGDPEHADRVNLKDVDKYLKTVDILHKLTTTKVPGQKAPTVGLNLGEGATVKRIDDSTVEITPAAKDKSVGSVLRRMAEEKRAKTISDKDTSDIKEKDSQKGESNNETDKT